MKATDIFRKGHGIIRRSLVSLDRAPPMRPPRRTIVARNVVNYLDVALREHLGSKERWILRPLAGTGPDAAGVVTELEREHRELEARLTEFKALTRQTITEQTAPIVRVTGLALVKAFLHHMFLSISLLQEAGRALEEPAAID